MRRSGELPGGAALEPGDVTGRVVLEPVTGVGRALVVVDDADVAPDAGPGRGVAQGQAHLLERGAELAGAHVHEGDGEQMLVAPRRRPTRRDPGDSVRGGGDEAIDADQDSGELNDDGRAGGS